MSKKASLKNYIDETRVRLVAAQVFILTLVTILSGWSLLAAFLTIDFALRAFTGLPSLLAIIAKGVAAKLPITPKSIFAPPKRFAALLGFMFSCGITLFLALGMSTAAYVTGGILAACALLEAMFNVCLGCYVYNWIVIPFTKIGRA